MTPTDQVLLNNDTREWITFDVSADIAAYMADTINHGWYIAKQNNNNNERIVFWSREDSQGPRLILFVTHDNPVPAEAPDTLPSWVYAPANLDSNTTALPGVFLKNIVIVEFKPSATANQRQAAVDSVDGIVIGGVPSIAGEGHYYLQVPDTVHGGGLVSAVQKLEILPQVQLATYEFDVAPMYRKPRDDANNWSSWHTDRKTLTGQNWALEAVLAPLAWGCATGDSSLRIAVVDGGFPTLPPSHDLTLQVHPAPGGGSPYGGDHGIGVSSLLAARGNNQQGMTGVMWNANLHGYDAGALIAGDEHAFVGRVLQQIKDAADGGARIINLSLGVKPHWADSTRELAGRGLDSTLSALGKSPRGKRPLMVIAAGNSTEDASRAGFPRVSAGTNADQVVVVAASTKDSALWAGGEGGSGSNFGPLVTVAAPGKTVYFLRQNGSIDTSSGTSASAPIVSGIAGLLLSFDSRLTADSLKKYIVDGAAAGNWKATRVAGGEQYPIVNAYESLKLAAQREGAPLCGNRVWSSDSVIVTRRSSGVEPLFTFGEPGSYVNVRHGGKRVDVFGWNSFGGIFLFTGSGWEQDLSDTLPDTLAGGTYNSSTSVSHDSDSLTYAWGSSTPTSTRYDVHVVSVADWQADRPNKVAEFTVSSGGSGEDCWRQKWVDSLQNYECTDTVAVGLRIQTSPRETFSPLNDRIIVAINRTESNTTLGNDWLPCPATDTVPGTQRPRRQCKTQRATHRSVGVEFREILRPSNQVRPLPWDLGGTDNVYSLGISEDGKELVLGIGSFESATHQEPDATFTWVDEGTTDSNCRVSYRAAATFNLLQDEPTDDVCSRDEGVGTIAPIRRSPNSNRD